MEVFDLYNDDEIRSGIDHHAVTDYLRSIGIAIPFMKYSVEDLLKMNWIKIK